MRLMFVYYLKEDRGSAQDIFNYAQIARARGHEVALYGSPDKGHGFNYSLDVASADAVIFIFEWPDPSNYCDNLDFVRLLERVPRRRRVVVDCDGAYNNAIEIVGDRNHPDETASRRWIDVCDSLSDKIFQPTLHPQRPNVRSFLFHAYNPGWEQPLELRDNEYGMVYVGNNWFRWRGLQRVLQAIEAVRDRVGRVCLVGNGWDSPAPWAKPDLPEDAYRTDVEYLRRLNIDIRPPIRFDHVIEYMGKGVFSPVIYRPLFDRLQLVTCRTFETLAANTLPLFCQDADYVEDIYGSDALELMLPDERPEEKILDLICRTQYYADIVLGIRRRLAKDHSYAARLEALIEIVKS